MSLRRRMMMQNRVVNLFDKNSEDIIYHARLDNVGLIISGDEYGSITFVSQYIRVIPLETYVLVREVINAYNSAYNRWLFYSSDKSIISMNGSTSKETTIKIPENCYYIRFNGLITDIDNVKFYKA